MNDRDITSPSVSPRPLLRSMNQADAYRSPWSRRARVKLLLWIIAWALLCRWTPKHLHRWRALVLKLFGAHITGTVFVASSAVIKMPWNLTMDTRACLGPRSEVYNLAPITLGARCTIAQQAYLCGGTHDFTLSNLPLVVGQIAVGADAFIGARAFVLPGVTVGEGAVVGACSLVSRDLPPWTFCAGNPCKPLGPRSFQRI